MKKAKCLYFVVGLVAIATITGRADIVPDGNGFIAGVRLDEFTFYSAPETSGRQRQDQWCWAACVQMVLNYHGLYVTQEQVVQRIKGQMINQGGTEGEILAALSGWAPDSRGRFSAITASPYVWGDALINDLAYKWPLIAAVSNPDGQSGHALVLTAVRFHYEPVITGYWYGRPIYGQKTVFDYVVLRDPWPFNESRQVWPWGNFVARLRNLNRIYVTRL